MTSGRQKSTVALVLALLLAVTSYSMATVRGAAAAEGQIALCIGETIEVIYVDAEGAPTFAPHLCPECILSFAPSLDSPAACARAAQSSGNHAVVFEAKDVPRHIVTGFRGRAPPSARF